MVFVMFLKCFKNGGCQSGKHGSEAVVLWFMPILSGTMNAPPPQHRLWFACFIS